MAYGPKPWQQLHWDARAAANFMCGGAGSGLIIGAALVGAPGWLVALGAALVGLGLLAVAAEIGRPLRSLNVFIHAKKSWMSREALAAVALMPAAAAAWAGIGGASWFAAIAAAAFLYCQARILKAAKGIPTWREPRLVPLILATGVAEGSGLLLVALALGAPAQAPAVAVWLFGAALAARLVLWQRWRAVLRTTPKALAQIDSAGHALRATTLLPLAAVVVLALLPAGAAAPLATALLAAAAGLIAFAGGQWFKLTLITRAAFNQGFTIPHRPVRGTRS